MSLNGKNILVTGAAGFIGSHLVERLAGMGAKIRAFVHYNAENRIGNLMHLPPEILRKIDIRKGDLRDGRTVLKASDRMDLIFHLGAIISIPYSYDNPQGLVETNVMGTFNVLEVCLQNKCKLVHTSTSEVYGTARQDPMVESHPLQAQSPYAASKIAADKLVESYVRSYKVNAVTLRPFNTYGPRQSARAIIPAILSQALRGSTIRLGNIRTRRDFTYVSDTVDAFVRIAQKRTPPGCVVHIGTSRSPEIREVVRLIGRMLGKSLTIRTESRRVRPDSSEVETLRARATLAKTLLGWKPLISLNAGLARTLQWYKIHGLPPSEYAT